MPRDGSGTYSVPNVFLPNTVMSATAVNANFTDAGSALTGSLARDGQSSMTGQFKAAAGTLGAPGISFGVDTDTGFRRASEDEMRWVTGGVDRFWIDSTGQAFLVGDLDISGNVGLAAPIVIATTSASLLTLRRTENDATARIVEEWHSGSGAGAKATLEVVGDGNNAVQTVRWRVNAVAAFEATQALFTSDLPLAVGANIRLDTSGYLDLTEIATPSNPASNVARLYAVDVGGLTKLQFKDSAGSVTTIPPGADSQIFTASGTWTKPSFGTIALVQAWGAGGSGGRGGAGDGGGGGGGGAYVERYVAVASLSASVSVTIGAGGIAQTADDTDGNVGGNSTFGAYASAFGGGGGGGDTATSNGGGGGGGLTSAGSVGAAANGGAGGGPSGLIGGVSTSAAGNSNPFGGGGGDGASSSVAGVGLYGGGGGGFGSGTNTETAGGSSVFGGGGGGGGSDTGTGAAGGIAVVYGGNGGAGNTGAVAGTAGTAPGGGGGGSESANSGAGARGEIRVTVW